MTTLLRRGPAWRPRWRGTELLLLLLAGGIALSASLPLALRDRGGLAPADLALPLALVGGVAVLHLALGLRGRGEDELILPLLLVLTGLAMAFSQRLAPALAGRQLAWQLLAVAALAAVLLIPFDLYWLQRYRYTWAALGLGLVALTLVAGRPAIPGGPPLWLGIGSLRFQPAEALKLLLVVWLAAYLTERRELLAGAATRIGPLRLPPLPYLAPMAIVLGLSLLLLAAQGDLGAALLLYAITLGMLYLASGRASYVLFGLVAFLAGAWLLYRTVGIVEARATLWLDPWSDAQGGGYQLVQALMAFAAGGLMGRGIGFGAPTAIPAVHTDFVYAAIVEEMGLAGAMAVLTVFGLLFLRGFRAASRAEAPFERLLAAGLVLALAVQTLIILGGNLRVIPLTGITLPFVSHGGSSLLVSAIGLGLVLRISAERRGGDGVP